MKHLFKLVVVALIHFSSMFVIAQDIQVIRDPSTRLSGLYSSKKGWIRPTEYWDIQRWSHCFLLTSESKTGMKYEFLDTLGNSLGIYDHIRINYSQSPIRSVVAIRGGKNARVYHGQYYSDWEGGKYFILDTKGVVLRELSVDYLYEGDNYMVTRIGKTKRPNKLVGLYGIVRYDGTQMLPNEYDYIENRFNHDHKFQLVNKGGNWKKTENGWVMVGGLWGMINEMKELKIPVKYSWISSTGNPQFFKVAIAGKQSLKNPFPGVRLQRGMERPERYIKAGLFGYVDSSGNEIITPEYTWISELEESPSFGDHTTAFVATKEKFNSMVEKGDGRYPKGVRFALISPKGNALTPYKYTWIETQSTFASESVFIATTDSIISYNWLLSTDDTIMRYLYLDVHGRELTPMIFNYLEPYSPTSNTIYGIKYHSGKTDSFVLNHQWLDELESDHHFPGYFNHDLKMRYGFMKPDFTYFDPAPYIKISWLSNNLRAVYSPDGKAAILNVYGDSITPFRYQSFRGLVNRTRHIDTSNFIIKNGNGCNIIDQAGRLKFNWFNNGWCFNSYGIIPIKKAEKWGLMNYKGDTILPCGFDSMSVIKDVHRSFTKHVLLLSKNGKYGLVSLQNGHMILQPIYERIFFYMKDRRLYIRYSLEGKEYNAEFSFDSIIPIIKSSR